MPISSLPKAIHILTAVLVLSDHGASNNLPTRRDAPINPSEIVDLSNFPKCAVADCVTSRAFSSSQLGCADSSNLTVGCLCDTAVSPLACAPTGPSDEDHCWTDVEDWMLDICHSVKSVPANTMPDCMEECIVTYLVGEAGCGPLNGTVSRNCFCKLAQLDAKLAEPKLAPSVEKCKGSPGCWRKIHPGFAFEEWKDGLCTNGLDQTYDQESYDSYVKTTKKKRLALPIALPFVAFVFAFVAGCVEASDDGDSGSVFGIGLVVFLIATGLLYLVVLPPVYLLL